MPSANQTTVHHGVVAAKISAPRLTPYLAATEGNVRRALRLYQWNVELSGAVTSACTASR